MDSFFLNDTATTEIYTLSLHDALPIYLLVDGHRRLAPEPPVTEVVPVVGAEDHDGVVPPPGVVERVEHPPEDRKSTRLNSSHANISYAVFCLKNKSGRCS